MTTYTPQFLDNIQLHFIVARARTGSTLLATTLGLHENILSITEQPYAYFLHQEYHAVTDWSDKVIRNYCSDFFLFAFPSFKLQFDNNVDLFATLKQHQEILNYERVVKICALCFNPGKEKSSINIIVFKELIMNNYLKEAATRFPKSKFIFLYRHPLDTLCRVKNLRLVINKSEKLIKTAIRWKHAMQSNIIQFKFIESSRQIRLSYEQLILTNESAISDICLFLNVSFDPTIINDRKRGESLSSKIKGEQKHYARISRVHESTLGAINPNKIGVWRKELTTNEAQKVWKICSKVAYSIGYHEKELETSTYTAWQYYIYSILFFFRGKVLTKLWYKSPFWLKRIIKKRKKRSQ